MEEFRSIFFGFEEHGEKVPSAGGRGRRVGSFLRCHFCKPFGHAGFRKGDYWEGKRFDVVFIKQAENGVFEEEAVQHGHLTDLEKSKD